MSNETEIHYLYCFQCLVCFEDRLVSFAGHFLDAFGPPRCGVCNQGTLKKVKCLVCLDSGEVSALGEEIECPRGCKRRDFPELTDEQKAWREHD